MKFHIGIFVMFSFVSAACATSYNPYRFFFYFDQRPCVPFDIEYKYNEQGGCKRFYGTDLDYMMKIWTYYPPLYVQNAQNSKRNYINYINIELYKQKNEDVYHLAYSVSTLGLLSPFYRSDDVTLSKDMVELIFNDTQFPIKQFPENTHRYHGYSLSTHSLKELSEGDISHAFKGLITFVNVALKNNNVAVKLDENDLRATMTFRKNWLSLTTWNRWAD